jgi:steroid delta-isomerase-like uncharacterized protein
MPEGTLNPSSLKTIEKLIAALKARDTQKMQSLQLPDFILDWVHADAFENKPLTCEETNRFWSVWFAGFSQIDFEVTRTIAAEAVVVVQWTFTGTHDGPLAEPLFDPPLEPTGKTIRLRGVSIYDLQDDLLQRETMYIDLATLHVELGVTL